MKLSQRIIREWSAHKTRFTVLIVITFISAILRTSIPYFYKLIVDLLESRAPLEEMTILISAIIFLSVSRFIVYTYFQSNRAMMNMKFQWEIRRRAFFHLMKAGKLKFQHLNVGEVVTRLSDDAEKMSWFLSSGIFRGFDAILIFFFTVFFLLMMSPLLTLITVSVLTLMVVFMFVFDALFKKAFDLLQRSISRTNDYVHSTMSGISIIKSYNREEKVAEYFESIIKNRKTDELRVVKLDIGSRAFYMTLHMLSTVTVLAAGGMMKINGTITLGTLVAFLALVRNIINPVLDIGNLFVRGKSASVSNRRICELEDVGADHHADGNADATFLSSVSLDAAGFSFQGTRILSGISMEINKGDKVAIMGKIGSGKSFLSMMLSGVITPTSGRMVIDGLDSLSIRRSTYRKLTGYASQTPVVFSDSIRNNIIMGAEYDEADFAMAVSVSQLDKEMEKFNLGPDTLIGPKGKTLSGGQKQRLALARALYRKPELLILDDITSALDAETEMSLWDELFEKMPDQTLVLVTHRPYTAKTADIIYVMQDGSVAESGTHDELMAYNSLYRTIYDSGPSES